MMRSFARGVALALGLFATQMAAAEETPEPQPEPTGAEIFTEVMYQGILDREPRAMEKAYWTKRFARRGRTSTCLSVAHDFYRRPIVQYKLRVRATEKKLVVALHAGYLGRKPTEEQATFWESMVDSVGADETFRRFISPSYARSNYGEFSARCAELGLNTFFPRSRVPTPEPAPPEPVPSPEPGLLVTDDFD